LLDLEPIARNLLDTQQHAIPMKGSERDGFEDEEIEGTLQEVETRRHEFS
jgi:hypothetical protein